MQVHVAIIIPNKIFVIKIGLYYIVVFENILLIFLNDLIFKKI